VPTFAPIIIGTALCNVKDPVATMATTRDVVVELLWIIAVMSKPINNPAKGFEVARMIVSTVSFPRCCKEEIIRSIAKRNNRRAAIMYSTILRLSQNFNLVSMISGFSSKRLRGYKILALVRSS
jgi:hypothetical protein